MEDIFIPIGFFVATFGIIWVIFSTRNRERMAMIEKGVNPKDFISRQGTSIYGILKWALLLAGVGLGIFLASLVEAYTDIHEEPAYFAFALFFGGLGLLISFLITKKGLDKKGDSDS